LGELCDRGWPPRHGTESRLVDGRSQGPYGATRGGEGCVDSSSNDDHRLVLGLHQRPSSLRRNAGRKPDGAPYIEEIGQPERLRLVSSSDVFTPTGSTKVGVIWGLSVRKTDDKRCEFTNTVTALPRRNSRTSSANREFPGKSSRPPVNRFQRLVTGRRRLSSRRVFERHALRDK
jgi:hypothetical protein